MGIHPRVLAGYMDQKVAVMVNVSLIELESRITLEKGLVRGGTDYIDWCGKIHLNCGKDHILCR